MIGQGVNQETVQLSQVPHFSNGGSIHYVVNNQVGFTTPSARGKTSRNCTDLAKQIGAPVIHCNGDEPEVMSKQTNENELNKDRIYPQAHPYLKGITNIERLFLKAQFG